MADLYAYTDGACSGNPGPGGWGVLLLAKDGDTVVKERDLKGGEPATTNNRMELLAAINALETLDRPSTITVVTDSQYVKNGVTGWIHGWKKNGWKTAAKKPVKNAELWQRLDSAAARHQVRWEWIKGHAGHPEKRARRRTRPRRHEAVQGLTTRRRGAAPLGLRPIHPGVFDARGKSGPISSSRSKYSGGACARRRGRSPYPASRLRQISRSSPTWSSAS